MKVIIAGDFCDAGRVSALIAQEKYAELFSDVKPIVESADYSMVNFEFPVVEGQVSPIVKCGFCLSGQKASIAAVKYAGFKCATLANNHILDQGETNCMKTQKLLKESGIDTVGVGADQYEATQTLYKEVNGEMLAIINCCEHEFSIAMENVAGANGLNPIQQYYAIQEARRKARYVLVVVHGGHEHYQLPSPRMQETYRFFIDAGADAVVNHHQHCYSGYEVYQGKPIFYGLGNFCFDSTGYMHSIWNEGYMVELQFAEVVSFEIIPYSQCDEDAKVSLMNADEKERCFKKIHELNSVIANDKELKKQFACWSESRRNVIEMALSPWNSRVTKKLASLGVLPKKLPFRKRLFIRALLQCEAHYDTFMYVVRNQKKR